MNNNTESISEIAKLAKQASFELAQQNREKKRCSINFNSRRSYKTQRRNSSKIGRAHV